MNKHTLSNFYTIFLINLPFLLLKVKVLVAQLFLILSDPMDCRWSVSSVHGILQARSRSDLPFPPLGDLLDPGIEPGSSALQADCLPSEPSRKPKCFIFSHWSLILDPNPCSRSIVTWLGMEVRKLTEKMKVEMKVRSQIHIFWYLITHLSLSLHIWLSSHLWAAVSLLLSFICPACSGPDGNQKIWSWAQSGLIGWWRGGDAAEWWWNMLLGMTSALKRQFSPKCTAGRYVWELLQERLAFLTPVL